MFKEFEPGVRRRVHERKVHCWRLAGSWEIASRAGPKESSGLEVRSRSTKLVTTTRKHGDVRGHLHRPTALAKANARWRVQPGGWPRCLNRPLEWPFSSVWIKTIEAPGAATCGAPGRRMHGWHPASGNLAQSFATWWALSFGFGRRQTVSLCAKPESSRLLLLCFGTPLLPAVAGPWSTVNETKRLLGRAPGHYFPLFRPCRARKRTTVLRTRKMAVTTWPGPPSCTRPANISATAALSNFFLGPRALMSMRNSLQQLPRLSMTKGLSPG